MSRRRPRPRPPRLIDLHVPWNRQYIGETTQHDPTDYPPTAGRLESIDGYLNDVAAAFIPAERSAADWARQADPWAALGLAIARIEAEFPGRILADRADFERWRDDPDGLTWAVLGIAGGSVWVRDVSDLDRLGSLIERGARWFRPVESAGDRLGGAGLDSDDRGLEPLGTDFLNALKEATPESGTTMVDLSAMSSRCRSDVLDWFEADPARRDRLSLIVSPASIDPARPGALDRESLKRLRALGGFLGLRAGLPDHDSTESLRIAFEQAAEVPFLGEPGPAGIGLATDFLGPNPVATGLETADAIIRWLVSTFDEERSTAWLRGNGQALIGRLCGASS